MPSGRHESLGEQKLTPQGQVFEVRPEATRESCVESGELDVTDDENAEIESMRGNQLVDWPCHKLKMQ